jgi:myo-inositol-1(or 4)-monophosphatase
VRDFIDLVDVAGIAAGRAAEFLRGVPRQAPGAWTEKSRHDFVSDADRGAEALIAATLRERTPEARIVGEELSPAMVPDGEIIWIVDPLDGTTNFLHGYPQYAVSIGCVVRNELAVGVVHDVPRDLVYRAVRGHGAWLGAQRLSVSQVAAAHHALIGTGFPFKDLNVLTRYLDQFTTVTRASSGIRRAGSAALDLVDVAAGRLDGFWELTLAPWDVAAGVVLIREAGGIVTTLEGGSDVLGGGSIVAGNPTLHAWLCDVLRTG